MVTRLVATLLSLSAVATATAAPPLHVTPAEVHLKGNFDRTQLLVTGQAPGPESADLTSQVRFATSDASVVTISETGLLRAAGNGQAEITVVLEDRSATATVTVEGYSDAPSVPFDEQIRPILSRLGCNAGECHASQFGKGGFVLSVVGFDPNLDFNSLVRDRQQRRINFVQPEESLFLKKPTMQVPHGGGQRLLVDSSYYDTLVAWVRAGAPGPETDAPKVTSLEVWPRERLVKPDDAQQLRAVAHYSDGRAVDVTHLAKFDSMDEAVLSVTPTGRVTVEGRGQAPIMVRYEGHANIALFVSPYGPPAELADWENRNFVDELAAKKFRELGIEPSPVCDDATFIRRAYLDAIGTIPQPEDVLAFVADEDPAKREKLVDRLLGLTGDPNLDVHNDQYAAYWTLKWSDLLRNTTGGQRADEQRMWAMHNWIRESMRTNKPFDEFVREVVTAKGSIYSSGPASYYRVFRNSSELAEATSQLFLGVRLACAKCHHHPFEKYSQADYYSFAAFFARIGTKNSEEFGLFGREAVVMVRNSGDVRHPRTGQLLKPKPLDGDEMEHELDRRIPLAEWLTSADNRDFAKAAVNRYVSYLLGRGLVEPVDDMRATNPPTNPALMEALADHFIDSGFDLKQLIRVIMTSRLYQLDSQPTEQNASDSKFYSHFKVKRIPAEPLLDAIDQVTGVQTKFKSLPLGTRAIELPDGEYPNYFLNTFGKPRRASVCECERMPDENLGQALHTLNGDILATKIADKNGRVAKLLASEKSDAEIITQLYLLSVGREPTNSEVATARQFLDESPSRDVFFQDLLWALLNSKQFLFVR
ncbi:Bacterial Ig-like domain (group 2) [Maioricimonas rarisocia]|uniref:Bacterial Ig-like domain (Group 2) n=1 Tax=Maioricimonas rarisocia TaxID=2528026 RepID=A0A517ZAH0_9PLAN|nr:DUF1549 domain-containing protein [Maioricimonas rarisocia]QDU39458.1 Bacterial Ig-like domain (group 2) [Maioricimonas rarisocia]